jgi:hypothetical protein
MPQDDTPIEPIDQTTPLAGTVEQSAEPTLLNVNMSSIFVKFNAESLLAQLRSLDEDNENSEKIVRLVRDQLLSHTDWTQATDAPLTDTVKQNFANFRQTLRDITNHPDYPDSVVFPPIPSTK